MFKQLLLVSLCLVSRLPVYARSEVIRRDIPSIGFNGAPVTIDVGVDLECPFSAGYLLITLPKLLETYPRKVRFQIHQVPLGFHRIARPAAEAAVCAHEQGAYWEFQAAVLEAQWRKPPAGKGSALSRIKELTREEFARFAKDFAAARATRTNGHFSAAKFENCLALSETQQKVVKQKESLELRGLNAVPTSFIGETMVDGNREKELFDEVKKKLGL